MFEILNTSPVSSIIFIFTIVTSVYAFYNEETYGKFMLHPYSVARGKNVYQLITSGFIHKDWSHLIFNMLSYFFFAFDLERQLGHWQFGLLYFLSLIISDIPSVFKHRNNFNYNSLGASGAVCAVLFSFIMFSPLTTLIIFPIPFPIPSVIYGFLFLIYTSYAGRKSNDGINHDAHFYGALAGVFITIALYPEAIKIFVASIQAKWF
ncbi:rhomboid family intramembrane serine protease [Pedobacter psychrophilus]|uniref:Rhomboid family intramembrane serine protease n=1 Tax=Pedobacter psychrophilus TaxID=1826909 RepID=A0A179DHD8_9SPHI|nr:rhomboid family intramembrane serine protease [Pedobacter psychrophilus]OAQ40368.1 rhomboid family intramembrane serine protease [Pedobacter psychrophilus]